MADDLLDNVAFGTPAEATRELFNEGYEAETVAGALLTNAVTAYGCVHAIEKLAQQLAQLCLNANDRPGGQSSRTALGVPAVVRGARPAALSAPANHAQERTPAQYSAIKGHSLEVHIVR
jgi:hypothetical protein